MANGPPIGSGGFPAGARATAVPNLFFSAFLPKMEDPAELVVSVYLFFIWQQQRPRSGSGRYLSRVQLAADATLREALARLAGEPEEALRRGLELAVRRGTLLRAQIKIGEEGRSGEVYLINDAGARAALARLQQDGLALPQDEGRAEAREPAPNIFALYEENIGAVTPLIAQELAEAEAQYPMPWIEAALREAVLLNKRSWRYVQRILERYAREGPDYEETGRVPEKAGGRRRPSGPYRDLIGH